MSPQNRMRSAIRQLCTRTKHTQRYGEYKGWIFPTSRFKLSKMENGGKHESEKMNVTCECVKINLLLQDGTFGQPTSQPNSERTNERTNERKKERTNQLNNQPPTFTFIRKVSLAIFFSHSFARNATASSVCVYVCVCIFM